VNYAKTHPKPSASTIDKKKILKEASYRGTKATADFFVRSNASQDSEATSLKFLKKKKRSTLQKHISNVLLHNPNEKRT
jgi:hypothetical protein